MVILDLAIFFIIFGTILIHLHAYKTIVDVLFFRGIFNECLRSAIYYFFGDSVSDGDLQPSILKASKYMTKDHGESFFRHRLFSWFFCGCFTMLDQLLLMMKHTFI